MNCFWDTVEQFVVEQRSGEVSWRTASAVHTTNNNIFSSLIVGTLSVKIHPSNSPGIFGHRTILM